MTIVLEVVVGMALAGLLDGTGEGGHVLPGGLLRAGDAADGGDRRAVGVRLQPGHRTAQRRAATSWPRLVDPHLARGPRHCSDRHCSGVRMGLCRVLHGDLLCRLPTDPDVGAGGCPARRGRRVPRVLARQGADGPPRRRGRSAVVHHRRLPELRLVLRADQRWPVQLDRDPDDVPRQGRVPQPGGGLRVGDGGDPDRRRAW